MGCGASKGDDGLAEAEAALLAAQNKANEQVNLLRFKVEVMVNMLAMEEKKNESMAKRLETLKWALYERGINETTLATIIQEAEKSEEPMKKDTLALFAPERNVINTKTSQIDLAGALERAQHEFEQYKEDIVSAFAEEEGNLVVSMAFDEFMKQLYTATESLSKADVQILAMRFSDGSGSVSIPEFIEFFTTPYYVRMAKAATAAVRMSLDLLQIDLDQADGEEEEEGENDEEENGDEEVQLSSHLTSHLDRAFNRLVAMWLYVKQDLEERFNIEKEPEQEFIIKIENFKKVLLEIGGARSPVLTKAEKLGLIKFTAEEPEEEVKDPKNPKNEKSKNKNSKDKNSKDKKPEVNDTKDTENTDGEVKKPENQLVQIEPMEESDVQMLCDRFDVSGMIHFGFIIQHFTEANRNFLHRQKKKQGTMKLSKTTLPNEMSPFRLSSEWGNLKQTSLMQQFKDHQSQQLPSPQDKKMSKTQPLPPKPGSKPNSKNNLNPEEDDESTEVSPEKPKKPSIFSRPKRTGKEPKLDENSKTPDSEKTSKSETTGDTPDSKADMKEKGKKPKEGGKKTEEDDKDEDKSQDSSDDKGEKDSNSEDDDKPPGPEVVGGGGCCGRGKKTDVKNQPEILPPHTADSKNPKKGDKNNAKDSKGDKGSDDDDDDSEIDAKIDDDFRTPKGILKSGSRVPKSFESTDSHDNIDLNDTGSTDFSKPPTKPKTRFSRRDVSFDEEKPNSPLDDSESENDFNLGNKMGNKGKSNNNNRSDLRRNKSTGGRIQRVQLNRDDSLESLN